MRLYVFSSAFSAEATDDLANLSTYHTALVLNLMCIMVLHIALYPLQCAWYFVCKLTPLSLSVSQKKLNVYHMTCLQSLALNCKQLLGSIKKQQNNKKYTGNHTVITDKLCGEKKKYVHNDISFHSFRTMHLTKVVRFVYCYHLSHLPLVCYFWKSRESRGLCRTPHLTR